MYSTVLFFIIYTGHSLCPSVIPVIKIEVDLGDSSSPDERFEEEAEQDVEMDDEPVSSKEAEVASTLDSLNETAELDRRSPIVTVNAVSKEPDNVSPDNRAPVNSNDTNANTGGLGQTSLESRCKNENNTERESAQQDNQQHTFNFNLTDDEAWDQPAENDFRARDEDEINHIDDYGQEENNPEIIMDPSGKDLDAQMEDFYDANLMSPDDWTYRDYVKNELERIIRESFFSCRLIPFGTGSSAMSAGRDPFNLFFDCRGE
jgi:hypothetical protein